MWNHGNTVEGKFKVTSPHLPSFMAIRLAWHQEQHDEVQCLQKMCGYGSIYERNG